MSVSMDNGATPNNNQPQADEGNEDGTFKVILTKMHHTANQEELSHQLESMGHKVVKISIINNANEEPLPLFLIELERKENNNEIFEVRQLSDVMVAFEPFDKKSILIQSLEFGHAEEDVTDRDRNPNCPDGTTEDSNSFREWQPASSTPSTAPGPLTVDRQVDTRSLQDSLHQPSAPPSTTTDEFTTVVDLNDVENRSSPEVTYEYFTRFPSLSPRGREVLHNWLSSRNLRFPYSRSVRFSLANSSQVTTTSSHHSHSDSNSDSQSQSQSFPHSYALPHSQPHSHSHFHSHPYLNSHHRGTSSPRPTASLTFRLETDSSNLQFIRVRRPEPATLPPDFFPIPSSATRGVRNMLMRRPGDPPLHPNLFPRSPNATLGNPSFSVRRPSEPRLMIQVGSGTATINFARDIKNSLRNISLGTIRMEQVMSSLLSETNTLANRIQAVQFGRNETVTGLPSAPSNPAVPGPSTSSDLAEAGPTTSSDPAEPNPSTSSDPAEPSPSTSSDPAEPSPSTSSDPAEPSPSTSSYPVEPMPSTSFHFPGIATATIFPSTSFHHSDSFPLHFIDSAESSSSESSLDN